MAKRVRVAVIGAGAMGSLVAARLALAGFAPTLLGRSSPHLAAIQAAGLRVEEADGTTRVVPLRATTEPAAVAGHDLLVLLVKAWATGEALAPLRSSLSPATTVLTLQNGLGNAAAVRAALGDGGGDGPAPAVVVGVTSQAALRLGPGSVRHTGSGPTAVGREDGSIDDDLVAVAAALTAAGLPTEAVSDIEQRVWGKLAINAAINGLTALAGVPNGAVATDPGLAAAGAVLAGEVAAVARAHGIEPGEVAVAVAEVARATAANRSSMLRDLETGGQTEVGAIHEAVVAAGEAVGVETPANRVVAALVLARERAVAADGAGAEGGAGR